MKGVVVKSTGSWYHVRTDEGKFVECKLKGQFRIHGIKTTNPVAVGDRVHFDFDEKTGGVITQIDERKNYIIRKSINLSKQAHIIASNIDQLVIVSSIVKPRTTPGFIDRLLVTAEAYHIPAIILFNKIDLCEAEKANDRLHELLDLYNGLGYQSFPISALYQTGLEQVVDLLKDKTSLLSGHSGVGKSALLNAVDPNLRLKTGAVSEYNEKGKHTTTFAEMHPLSFGGFVIDTPGIKEFGLVHFEKQEVHERFPEFRALMHQCRFGNCTHVHEPGCAVLKALENGEISATRYRNYLSILNDENLDAERITN